MTPPLGLERRMSQRIPMTVGLHVYAYGVLVACGTTVDMSEHGLLMRINQDFSDDQLDPGRHLDVMLADAPPGQWLPIMVVRKVVDRVAACFLGVETQIP